MQLQHGVDGALGPPAAKAAMVADAGRDENAWVVHPAQAAVLCQSFATPTVVLVHARKLAMYTLY